MANNKTKRLRPSVLQADIDGFAALQVIADYNPVNASFGTASVESAKITMETKQTEEVQKQTAAESARDDAVAAEWAFHDFILGVKNQVKAQYGPDSNEYQSLGLKKKSEYRTGRRNSSGNTGGTT